MNTNKFSVGSIVHFNAAGQLEMLNRLDRSQFQYLNDPFEVIQFHEGQESTIDRVVVHLEGMEDQIDDPLPVYLFKEYSHGPRKWLEGSEWSSFVSEASYGSTFWHGSDLDDFYIQQSINQLRRELAATGLELPVCPLEPGLYQEYKEQSDLWARISSWGPHSLLMASRGTESKWGAAVTQLPLDICQLVDNINTLINNGSC